MLNKSTIKRSKIPTFLNIEEEYFDIFLLNESKSNLILYNKDKIDNFLKYICSMLNKELESDTLNEIINDTIIVFTVYPHFSLHYLNYFLPTCSLNSNYIIITASIISELIITKQKINDIMIDSFVNESLNAIIIQFQKNITEINLFGHTIPQQFKNNLIINLLISSKLNEKLSLLFLNHILPNNTFSNNEKFHFLLQKIIESSLINITIDKSKTEKELIKIITNESINLTSNLNENTLSFISHVIFLTSNNGKKDIKGLDTNLILPFVAIMTIYLQNFKKQIKFSNKNFQNLILKGIELLENKSSDLLKKSISFIISNLDFIKQNQIILYDQYTKIFFILATKFFSKQFSFDINLILPYLFSNSFYYYSIFNKYREDIFEYMVNNCSKIGYLNSTKLNLKVFQQEKIFSYLQSLIYSDKLDEIIQSFHFLIYYCDFTPFTNFSRITKYISYIFDEKINKKCWDDAILIHKFIRKNCYVISKDHIKGLNIPNHVLNILFDDRNICELNISELLTCLLNETNSIKKELYFNSLFNEMMKDQKIRCGYLEHLIYSNSDNYIKCSLLLQKLSNEYEKYQEDFIQVVKKQFYFHKENCILYKKENYKLHLISSSDIGNNIITELFNKTNDKPVICQDYYLLYKVAKSFPFLFYSNPQQAFKSVLQIFDQIRLIYNDLKNENRNILLSNSVYAMSFLCTIMQFPYMLDNFLQWFFSNIMTFTNSQIFGFILIILFFMKNFES